MGWTYPFDKQGEEAMAESNREDAKPWECGQRERKSVCTVFTTCINVPFVVTR